VKEARDSHKEEKDRGSGTGRGSKCS